MRTENSDTTAFSTFFFALLAVILGTAVVDPSRLLLLLIPASFLFAAYGMGLLLERTAASWIPALPPQLPVLALTLRLGTGISLLGLSTTIFGLLGLYRFAALPVIVALGWGLANIVQTAYPLRPFRPTHASVAGGLAIGIVWCIAWLWATIPPTFYDELTYHLPIAQYALRTGALPSFPWSFFNFMPHLSDLFLGWGLGLGGEIGARAMHFALWIGIWLAAWSLVESVSETTPTGWLGLLLAGAFASSVTFFFLGALPFAECSLTFSVLAAAALIIRPTTPSLWLPVGLLWGLTMSFKLSGSSWVFAEVIAAFTVGWSLRSLLQAGAVAAVVMLPWWGRAWTLTGNPVFPLGYKWIGTRHWNDTSQALLEGDLPHLADPSDLQSLLSLPYDMVAFPERFGSASEAGILAVIGVLTAISLPLWIHFVTPSHVTRRRGHAISLFMLVAGVSWVMTTTTTRFFAPALMLGLVALVALSTSIPKPARILTAFLLLLMGAWGAARFISEHDQVFSSQRVALGQESKSAFAARTLDHYETAAYVREKVPHNATILFIGESRPFYFDRPSLAPFPFQEHPLSRWVREAGSPEAVRDRLQKEGITHVVLNTREFKRLHDSYRVLSFSGPDAPALDQRLRQLPRTMTTLFGAKNVFLFEVNGPTMSLNK